jgi:hypothetical protein
VRRPQYCPSSPWRETILVGRWWASVARSRAAGIASGVTANRRSRPPSTGCGPWDYDGTKDLPITCIQSPNFSSPERWAACCHAVADAAEKAGARSCQLGGREERVPALLPEDKYGSSSWSSGVAPTGCRRLAAAACGATSS